MAPLATIAPFGFSFDPARLLRAYKAIGCRSCQFYRNDDNPPSLAEALRASAAAGLPFDSIHGRFGFTIDPSSPSAEHRRWCLNLYADEGRLARDLVEGSSGHTTPMVVVHPAAWTPGRAQLTPAEAAASDAYRAPFLREFLAALAEIGEHLGVTYLIENQPYNTYAGADPAALAQRILAAGSARIRMCLDTGHANITGDAVAALRAAAPAIAYFHIHDNDGRADDHRMPGDGGGAGEGGIDWPAFARALTETNCHAVRMLEVFYDEPRVESLAAAGLADRLKQALAL